MPRPRPIVSLMGIASALLMPVVMATGASAQAIDRPEPTCIQNVLMDRSGESEERATLLLRDGRVEAILPADAPAPKGMRIVDGEGLICLPAFIDSYTRTGVTTADPVIDQDIPVDVVSDVRVDMRVANRKGIQPAFRAAEALAIEGKSSEAWREAGFGAAMVSPGGQLLAGTSVLTTTREAAMRDLVLASDVFACATFNAPGPGYPSTLMGYHAQLRQFFLDTARHQELQARYAAGRPGFRPPFDADFEAGSTILGGDLVLLCDADSHRDIERWIKLADAFGFQIAISGGRNAWRVADVLAERDIPVLLTLDWGKEVKDPLEKKKGKKKSDAETETESSEEQAEETEEVAEIDWKYEAPLGVRLERRRKWEETRDCALRLHEAGVRFAFGTDSDKPAELLGRVRKLVEVGLPAEAALAGLTTSSAELFGVAPRIGTVKTGADATLALWSADPLTDEKAKPVFVFVDGYVTEFDRPEEGEAGEGGAPAEGLDVTGSWLLVTEGDGESSESQLTMEMAEDGSVEGIIIQDNPMDGSAMNIEVTGSVSGTSLKLSGMFSIGDTDVDFTYDLSIEDDSLSGEVTISVPVMPEPFVRSVEGNRNPSRR